MKDLGLTDIKVRAKVTGLAGREAITPTVLAARAVDGAPVLEMSV
jgi:hypothetical protein